ADGVAEHREQIRPRAVLDDAAKGLEIREVAQYRLAAKARSVDPALRDVSQRLHEQDVADLDRVVVDVLAVGQVTGQRSQQDVVLAAIAAAQADQIDRSRFSGLAHRFAEARCVAPQTLLCLLEVAIVDAVTEPEPAARTIGMGESKLRRDPLTPSN